MGNKCINNKKIAIKRNMQRRRDINCYTFIMMILKMIDLNIKLNLS
ncbi:TPA: hypothetical protein KOR49_002405 [Clostridioides difficile]|nr:hypothetical protein [Clostridioides difficile]MCA0574598.1 hypothetical protein [Clostridioides difficile]SJT19458.1 Uncharacterised protein [Clostridioides difficile]HBE8979556.1 hypothetical protein [Clostridioides difficile]HBF2384731.1 hypothetical protein [Clostridioides difficile]HBF2823691.1 hypothetical protein [Clostridioides difficile]